MKNVLLLAAMLSMGALCLNAQAPATQPAAESDTAPATVAPTPDLRASYEAACKQAALHRVAYEYCPKFAILLAGDDTPQHDALKGIANLTPDAFALANAYSIYKANSIVSEADQKAAINNVLTKLVSSPAVSSGSTSAVSKSVATSMLAVAVESGALTQTQTGNTITLQANPANIFREVYLGTPESSYLPRGNAVLESFSVSAGLATSANGTTTVPTTGSATSSTVTTSSVLFNSSATKLDSLTVSYEFVNKLTQKYVSKYLTKNKVQHLFIPPDTGTSPVVDKARATFASDFVLTPTSECDARKYLTITSSKETAAQSISQFVDTFDSCFNTETETAVAAAKAGGKDIDADWAAYNKALQADIASFQKSLKNQLSGWDASAQYVYNRPTGQPETHDFRFIANGDISKAAGSTWTANAAVSLYGSVPSGAQYGRLKDAQFSGELDKSLGSKSTSPSFSLAGYGQYQSKPSVLDITSSSVPSGVTLPANAQVFLSGTQGWLGVVQAKITLHVGSAQIPLAGKWSNKTDLLDKSKLGAQFGVSYDFSQLKQLIGMGSSN